MTESQGDAFDRGAAAGQVAGRIEERLKEHDTHFQKINGSIDRIAGEMHAQTLAVQQLRDLANSNSNHDKLQDAKLRDVREASHASMEKISWIIGGAVAVVGIIVTLILLLG